MGRRNQCESFGDFGNGGDESSFYQKEDHHRSRKGRGKGKAKGSKLRSESSGSLDSLEQDYVANVETDEDQLGTFGSLLNTEDLLESFDKLNFIPVESDDETENAITEAEVAALRQSRKKKNKKQPAEVENDCSLYDISSFNQLNRDLKLFLKDDEEDLLEMAPAAGDVRKYVHLLANQYRLKSFTVGKGTEKRLILQKTETTGLPANHRDLDKLLETGNKALKWSLGEGKKGKSGGKSGKRSKVVQKASAKPEPGTIVGHGSGPIKEDNIGNKMLQKMGWTPGTGLGRDSDGITQPIAAVVKAKRTGLV